MASGQRLCCPGEVARLGVRDCPCACGVGVVFVRVGRGVQGIAFPQAQPWPWAALCESTSVLSPGTCLVCALWVWGVYRALGGADGVAGVGINGPGRAGQCPCAFESVCVQVCVSVRCFCMMGSIRGCSRTARAA